MDSDFILFASDLDNTLIHSYKIARENDICVEQKDGKPLSFMSPKSHALLKQIIKIVNFVPITTRSLEQYNRIEFFNGYRPHYAITSNGGHLLIDNQIDELWYHDSKLMLQNAYDELHTCMKILEADDHITLEPRIVDDLFLFAKSQNPKKTMKTLNLCIDARHVVILNNLDKIYAVPVCLNKGTAVKRLTEKIKAQTVICAGDSLFDVSMLRLADIAIAPRCLFNNRVNKKYILWDNAGCFSEFVLDNIKKIINTCAPIL